MPSILETLSIKQSRSDGSNSSRVSNSSARSSSKSSLKQKFSIRADDDDDDREGIFEMIFEDPAALSKPPPPKVVSTSTPTTPKQKRKSRKYIRPIFKEPGAKIGMIGSKSVEDEVSLESDYEIRHPLVKNFLGDIEKMSLKRNSSDQSVIQPQSHALQRMKTIVGRSRPDHHDRRGGQFDTNRYLNRRDDKMTLQMRPPTLQRTPSELSTIRRDVVNAMSDVIVPSSNSKSRVPNHLAKYSNHSTTTKKKYCMDFRDDASTYATKRSARLSSTMAEF
jgi:hypothetical protein